MRNCPDCGRPTSMLFSDNTGEIKYRCPSIRCGYRSDQPDLTKSSKDRLEDVQFKVVSEKLKRRR